MASEEPRSALVTGASSGVGRAVASALARVMTHVYVVGRNECRLAEAAEEVEAHGAEAIPVVADLTSETDIADLVAAVYRRSDGVDVLVHAAGIYVRGELRAATLDALDDQYRTNVRAPYQLTQELLPALTRRHGDVIFVNSTQGLNGRAGIGQYAATQHARRAIADSFREEINVAGVRSTTLHLGRTATPMQESIFAERGQSYERQLLIQPEDVAEVIVAVIALPKRTQLASLILLPTHKWVD